MTQNADTGRVIEPNCMMGYHVHNRHNNCPYSLMCAVCDIDDEQQRASHNGRSEP